MYNSKATGLDVFIIVGSSKQMQTKNVSNLTISARKTFAERNTDVKGKLFCESICIKAQKLSEHQDVMAH